MYGFSHSALKIILILISISSLILSTFSSDPVIDFDLEKDKDLMKYMQDLNNYFQLYGRPRFGKRSLNSFQTIREFVRDRRLW
uniref:Neuropeptide Y prohormone-6 n=1 Tax=Schmidtea mediterranea TaxID=79327 RepID=E3CTK6_SCHMD|nr:TPA_inf: neuropeptide Y prohormone-6 [Schmidtea mediterranea]